MAHPVDLDGHQPVVEVVVEEPDTIAAAHFARRVGAAGRPGAGLARTPAPARNERRLGHRPALANQSLLRQGRPRVDVRRESVARRAAAAPPPRGSPWCAGRARQRTPTDGCSCERMPSWESGRDDVRLGVPGLVDVHGDLLVHQVADLAAVGDCHVHGRLLIPAEAAGLGRRGESEDGVRPCTQTPAQSRCRRVSSPLCSRTTRGPRLRRQPSCCAGLHRLMTQTQRLQLVAGDDEVLLGRQTSSRGGSRRDDDFSCIRRGCRTCGSAGAQPSTDPSSGPEEWRDSPSTAGPLRSEGRR